MAKRPVNRESPAPFERFSRFHAFFGPPLLPSAQDLEWCWEGAAQWLRDGRDARVLLLGATPEYYHLPWPQGTDLLAVDFSRAMIDAVWPGPENTVLCANWLSMGLPAHSRDLALCDGGLPLLDYPQGQQDLIRSLRNVLSDGGLCIFRMFVTPPEREAPGLVVRDFGEGNIRDLSTLVLRMNMALQKSPETGICFGEVYEAISAIRGLGELFRDLGWSAEHLALIDDCRHVQSRWHVLSLEQTTDLFCRDPGGFRIHSIRTPPGEIGRRCPTMTLQRC
jgi:hypothetical protein